MCRLLCLNPGIKRDEAIEIVKNFECGNRDGFGYSYLNNGKFVLRKWRQSFSEVLKNDKSILRELPHSGWLILHVRASTHGIISKRNSHPFLIDDKMAWMHNGVFHECGIFNSLFRKQGYKFNSDTDSEIAGRIYSIIGPRQFNFQMDNIGVFVALNKDGTLDVIKTSGQLEIDTQRNGGILIASDLDYSTYPDSIIAPCGWYRFDKDGKFIKYTSQKGTQYKKLPEKDSAYKYNSAALPSVYQTPGQFATRQATNLHGFGNGHFIQDYMD